MSLSMPITSKPFAPKYRTASEPTSPADPVTTTTDMSSRSRRQPPRGDRAHAQHRAQRRRDPHHLADAVHAFLIVHRHVGDGELQARGAEQQLVVAPAIVDTPRADVLLDALPVAPPQRLGSA